MLHLLDYVVKYLLGKPSIDRRIHDRNAWMLDLSIIQEPGIMSGCDRMLLQKLLYLGREMER